MGYLLATAIRTDALYRKQRCEYDLTTITRKVEIGQKQISFVEKGINRDVIMAKNQATAQAQSDLAAFQNQIFAQLGIDPNADTSSMSEEEKNAYQEKMAQAQQAIQAENNRIMQMLANYNLQVDQWGDYMREMQLDPLKQEDNLLQHEKDEAEENYNIAKKEYEEYKKYAESEVENIVPKLSGNG